MTLQHAISNLGARLGELLSSLGSKVPLDWGRPGQDIFSRIRSAQAHAAAYGQSRMPLLRTYWAQIHDWTGQARERLRHIDFGARTVQAVGAAVVLGTLYVAIWGVGPNLVPHSPDLVATRTAPIGTLTLQEPSEPQVAEQVSPANPAARPCDGVRPDQGSGRLPEILGTWPRWGSGPLTPSPTDSPGGRPMNTRLPR